MSLRLAALLILLAARPALAADLASCVAIAEPAARLGCYDALAGRAATPPPSPEQSFGAETLPPPKTSAPKVSLHARIADVQESRVSMRITLDNGQVWKVMNFEPGDDAGANGTEVTIEEALFGGYWMRIAGVAKSLRVARVK
jgi:hypothetical protein